MGLYSTRARRNLPWATRMGLNIQDLKGRARLWYIGVVALLFLTVFIVPSLAMWQKQPWIIAVLLIPMALLLADLYVTRKAHVYTVIALAELERRGLLEWPEESAEGFRDRYSRELVQEVASRLPEDNG